MIEVRKASERGTANYGWLDTKYSFSFANYYAPKHMGFSALRVINDDVIAPSAGFDTHGHKNMEIISYVLEGCIEHRDSRGNTAILPAGEFQLMSAGQGILHSEYNASSTENLRLLQIWIQPDSSGGSANYQQKAFGQALGLTTIITPTGENGTLRIKQNAKLHQLILAPNAKLSFHSEANNIYIHLISGQLAVNESNLFAGDGAKIQKLTELNLQNTSSQQLTALVFELP